MRPGRADGLIVRDRCAATITGGFGVPAAARSYRIGRRWQEEVAFVWCQLLPDLPDKPRQPLFVPPQSGLRRLPMVPSPLAEKESTRLRVSLVDGLLGVVLWLSRQAACALT